MRCLRLFIKSHLPLVVLVTVVLLGVISVPNETQALRAMSERPLRGTVTWSVILCTYTDAGPIPAPYSSPDYYWDLFVKTGTSGLQDYYRSVSYNLINFDGSEVTGWYTISMSVSEARAKSRNDRFWDCVDTAADSGYNVPDDNYIAVVTHPSVDMWGGDRNMFMPFNSPLGSFAHEMGHALGLKHSFSNDLNYTNVEWAQPGEYDNPWDLMSWRNTFHTQINRFNPSSIGLTAPQLDYIGWIPRDRIFRFGRDGIQSQTLTLAALNHPEAHGWLLVRIPFDLNDPFHYITAEFRRGDGWDTGIGRDIVLFHEVSNDRELGLIARLLRAGDSREPWQGVNLPGGGQITVSSISPQDNTATVIITSPNSLAIVDRSYGPNTCEEGYVWRQADAADYVCVEPWVRAQAHDDNRLAYTRIDPYGQWGPDSCVQGFVWRMAFPGDHVCVPLETRARAWEDNERAADHLVIR